MESIVTPDRHAAPWRNWTPPAVKRDPAAKVIHLKERSLVMLKKDLILRNPLRLLGQEEEEIIMPGGFGAVLARAGVGKTAMVIQIALNSLLQQKNILHISLDEPVGKVSLWYQEMFERLAQQYQVAQIDQLWDAIVPHRFIMTFRSEGFNAPRLEERLTDLTAQNIFLPDMVIIDGFSFESDNRRELEALKALARQLDLPVWFTITTHRHEDLAEDGLPVQLSPVQDLFDTALTINPEKDAIHVRAIKGTLKDEAEPALILDPATLLIRRQV
ncbi:MAG: AAA family ATPase [Desulfobacteraceae bacterium]